MWVGIVVVGVGISFFVFGDGDRDGEVWICYHGVFCFCVRV